MPQLPHSTIHARAAELRAAVAERRAVWQRRLVGKPLAVLAERDGTGHSPEFARVLLPQGVMAGQIVPVVPTRVTKGMLA